MSRQFAKLIALTFCLGMTFWASQNAQEPEALSIAKQTTGGRGPASIPALTDKELVLKPNHKHDLFGRTSKVKGPIQTELQVLGEPANQIGETFVLKGIIKASEDLSDVFVKWNIPSGLEIINGQLQTTIKNIQPDQPVEFLVTLRKLTAQNLQIHLLAGGHQEGLKFADTAQFNTVDQAWIEADIRRLAKENARIQKETDKLINHSSKPKRSAKVMH